MKFGIPGFKAPTPRKEFEKAADDEPSIPARRGVLMGAASVGLGASFGLMGARAFAGPFGQSAGVFDPLGYLCRASAAAGAPVIIPGPPRKLKLAWTGTGVCLASVPVAVERGLFARHNLDVELVKLGAPLELFLEAISTGKADFGVSMAMRWLKPLEQGFDLKITAAVHGGCIRLLAPVGGPIKTLADLKGKRIAVSDMNSPSKNFMAIRLHKEGIDPVNDVQWQVFPGELLRASVEKGEADALTDADPKTYVWLKDKKFTQISSNQDGEYAKRLCCVVGVGGALVRNEPLVAKAITQALLGAARYVVDQPADSAKVFAPYATNVDVADIEAMLRDHTHGHNPVGEDLKREIILIADELKAVQVMKPTTDSRKFADRIYADVLSA
jgi:NitT/TauT family transport system substrate-binding protein